ncbi:hypothetical protein U879_00490 [Defluviimonas sp. 20V17]|uniref:DUF2239 family protein n=1 Tax=Allgaiera indica TaxID=765699 RepID=A0AAN4UTK2_9RHOB|nr:DUF2239 family protein [Allgaiera indica]KDB05657.1 hypothetical protein U879_00490 [Defluviimonas sp. 20V17]GHE04331.1 hypothetical protein GCM10008024_31150 [Allgaiera indica]SDX39979.1 hypothetical protein SAMN05444006_11542 [Allgaiera indica]
MERSVTAFRAGRRVAAGGMAEVAKALAGQDPALVIDDATGRVVDLDLSGGAAAIAARYAPTPRGPGRPKLGVVAREVTLLPRHWDWLNAQPGGASATLRRLVEAARRSPDARARVAQERTYHALQALAGDLPGYEEALRALFAGDTDRFAACVAAWPEDLRTYALALATGDGDD